VERRVKADAFSEGLSGDDESEANIIQKFLTIHLHGPVGGS